MSALRILWIRAFGAHGEGFALLCAIVAAATALIGVLFAVAAVLYALARVLV